MENDCLKNFLKQRKVFVKELLKEVIEREGDILKMLPCADKIEQINACDLLIDDEALALLGVICGYEFNNNNLVLRALINNARYLDLSTKHNLTDYEVLTLLYQKVYPKTTRSPPFTSILTGELYQGK